MRSAVTCWHVKSSSEDTSEQWGGSRSMMVPFCMCHSLEAYGPDAVVCSHTSPCWIGRYDKAEGCNTIGLGEGKLLDNDYAVAACKNSATLQTWAVETVVCN